MMGNYLKYNKKKLPTDQQPLKNPKQQQKYNN